MNTFVLDGKTVSVWPGSQPGAPAVYLNTYGEEGGQVRAEMDKLGCPDCSLVAVSGLDWDKDLSPWPAPAVRRGSAACCPPPGPCCRGLPPGRGWRGIPWRGCLRCGP